MDSKQASKIKSFGMEMEKINAVSKYRRLHKITTLFRFMEIIIFLVMISQFSSQVPFSVKVFGDYFRGITFTVSSPKFVFVIGNVIILILFFKSRAVENNDGDKNEDSCYEYVKNCDRSIVNSTTVTAPTAPPPAPTVPSPPPTVLSPPPTAVVVPSNRRKISRSRSENPIRAECKEIQNHRELRRSVTEISRSKNLDRAARDKSYLEDELSCDDFRRTVEAFIARQQKILRDEEFSPMVCVDS